MAYFSLAIAVPLLGLLVTALAPRTIARRLDASISSLLVMLCLTSALTALAGLVDAISAGSSGRPDVSNVMWNSVIYIDTLSLVVSLMISTIGAVISRFSRNYLDGDSRRGQFFQHLALTLAASQLLVLSGNLLVTITAWILTSVGLHQLLVYKHDRPWAIWAARKKFLISRLGDLLLCAAIVQTYRCFRTFDYSSLFDAALAIRSGLAAPPSGVEWIGGLLALGAMTKSAQVPFHSWLPDTLETPTPVSALMHAGVINAGGFLVIRLSPLMVLSPPAMHLLVAVGALTALFAAMVMLTQTSIKRVLAYSTISQMGFMMLQCGLGAWSAAVLHILAHSAYKSYAFLSSGSVLDDAAPSPRRPVSLQATLGAALTTTVASAAVVTWFEIPLNRSPEAWLLPFILGLAVSHLLRTAWSQHQRFAGLQAMGLIAMMASLIFAAHGLTQSLLATTVISTAGSIEGQLSHWLVATVAVAFVLAYVLEGTAWKFGNRNLSRALYVHASNGFYLDIPARRLTAWFFGQRGAVP